MTAATQLTFVEFTEDWLETTWWWLSDKEIKKLIRAPDATREEQLEWFLLLPAREDYLIWGVQMNTRSIGVVGLKNIKHEQGEYWGYIGEKDLWGQGIGKQMQQFIVSVARKRGLKSLFLLVGKENVRALNSYKKFGFSVCPEVMNDELVKMSLAI